MDEDKKLWRKCADFHGHVCGGLTIGYKASLYAMELLGVGPSEDEGLVCVAENDACGVDAVQAALGCSVGKGNLLFRMRGKQAFSFFDRSTGRAVRLVLRETPDMPREERLGYFQALEPGDMFDVKEPGFALPQPARIFASVKCESCGESCAENMIRLDGGRRLCPDCVRPYNRFDI